MKKIMCICDYVILVLVLVKMCFFGLKKGKSRLLHWIAPKHTTGLFKSQIFFGMHRIPNGFKNLFYQNGKLIFSYSFSVKNTWNISSIKFKMWSALFYVNSLNFQQWNSNLDIIFQFNLRFKIGVFVFRS